MVNLDALSKAIGLSIGYTLELPWRFDGFAERVAKRNPEWQDKDKLQAEMSRIVSMLLTTNAWAKQSNGTPDVEEESAASTRSIVSATRSSSTIS